MNNSNYVTLTSRCMAAGPTGTRANPALLLYVKEQALHQSIHSNSLQARTRHLST